MIERAVGADSVQPRPKGSTAVETPHFAPGLQKSLLSDIFGVNGVSGHTAGQLEHRAAVALDERTKRVTIAATRIFECGIIAPIHQAVSLDSGAVPRLVGSGTIFGGGTGRTGPGGAVRPVKESCSYVRIAPIFFVAVGNFPMPAPTTSSATVT